MTSDNKNVVFNPNFTDDIDKIVDMLILDKYDFLKEYSYITESEFNNTIYTILLKLFEINTVDEYFENLIKEADF